MSIIEIKRHLNEIDKLVTRAEELGQKIDLTIQMPENSVWNVKQKVVVGK